MRLFRALSVRTFAWLWSGQSVSSLGDAIYAIALAWFVLEKTGSATAMGTVFIFAFSPMLLFLLVGGVAVDRFPRLRLMLASDVLRGVVVTVMAALAFGHRLEIWHVYVASLAFGLVRAFFMPAYVAVIPDIVPGDALPSANSLTNVSRELSGTLGPALGALIVGLWGTASAFLLDGISFFVSAGCLLAPARLPALHKRGTRSTSPLHDLREGVGTVLHWPWLWITIAIASFLNITEAGPRTVVLPFLIKQTLHAGVGTFGLVNSLWAAGFLLSSAWLGRSIRLRRRGMLGYGAWLIGGLMTLAMGLPITLAGVCVAIFVLGASIAVFDLVWTSSLQELVPRDLLGRVSSIDALGSFALIPVGFGVAGFAADRMGPAMVFVVGGAVTAAGIGLGLLHPAIRGLD